MATNFTRDFANNIESNVLFMNTIDYLCEGTIVYYLLTYCLHRIQKCTTDIPWYQAVVKIMAQHKVAT